MKDDRKRKAEGRRARKVKGKRKRQEERKARNPEGGRKRTNRAQIISSVVKALRETVAWRNLFQQNRKKTLLLQSAKRMEPGDAEP